MSKGRVVAASIVSLGLSLALSLGLTLGRQAPASSPNPLSFLAPDALREWLTVISSDEFEGRATFSPGLDKAAAYIADQLKRAGVKPGGDAGTYLQAVGVQTVQSVNQSTLTIEINGQSRVFKNGDGVLFPPNVGVKRTFTLNDVEFVGYGLNIGRAHNDYAGRNVRGKAVVWLGSSAPSSIQNGSAGRFLSSRASTAIDEMNAGAAISIAAGGGGNRTSSFTTSQRLDLPRAPAVTVSEEVLAFLFSGSGMDYNDLKAKSERRENLPPVTISGVRLTFGLDAAYRVTNVRMTQNVVGVIEGRDPQLKNAYVAFGAHYDHLGMNAGIPGGATTDRIYNGADDDGSGSTALIALANVFMTAPNKPRRSLLFAWHAGEERGLWGSEYLVEHSPIRPESIVAQLNIDMIGRNRDNRDSEENTVYAVGADRNSTELHNLLIDVNNSLASPLTLDFEMNDPADPERIYFRSDHFSYAAKGVPIIFFFTGLHPDYHQPSDSVEKIRFEKMSRITRLVYEIGRRLSDADRAPARDSKGARTGTGSSGRIP